MLASLQHYSVMVSCRRMYLPGVAPVPILLPRRTSANAFHRRLGPDDGCREYCLDYHHVRNSSRPGTARIEQEENVDAAHIVEPLSGACGGVYARRRTALPARKAGMSRR